MSDVNYDLFALVSPLNIAENRTNANDKAVRESFPDLPSEVELYRLFDQFNCEYFGGRLPRVEIAYSDRMLNAGQYTPSKREIKIGRKYHRIFSDEIEDTLKHEMIHLVHFNHSRKFKEMALKIGASVRAKSHPDLRTKYKYLYVCPDCGKEYPRRKRLRMAFCGSCCKSKNFQPKYKLKLIDSQAKKKQS